MVGWLRSNAAVKSQMQTGSAERFRMPSICRRVGSASAFSTATDLSTLDSAIGIAGGELTPLTRSCATAFTNCSLSVPLTTVYAFARIPSIDVDLSLEGFHGHDSGVRPSEVCGDRDQATRRRKLLRLELLWWIGRDQWADRRGGVFQGGSRSPRVVAGRQPGLRQSDGARPTAPR